MSKSILGFSSQGGPEVPYAEMLGTFLLAIGAAVRSLLQLPCLRVDLDWFTEEIDVFFNHLQSAEFKMVHALVSSFLLAHPCARVSLICAFILS